MGDFERVYTIDRLLRRRVAPSLKDIEDALSCSPATAKRALQYMRDRLGAPVAYHAERRGYHYTDDAFQLPGLWLTPAEIESLLLMKTLLEQMQPGLVKDKLRPMEVRLSELLGAGPLAADIVARRLRILSTPYRPVDSAAFEKVCTAALERRRLRIRYYTRTRNADTTRVISPQQLLYYRGNWYVDAFCHRSNGPRRFSLDAIVSAEILDEHALDMPAEQPAEGGYGIFIGPATKVAVLRFRAEAARWVKHELWHPRQRAVDLPEGELLLEVPYSQPRELLMDIVRHGAQVEVIQPHELRGAVVDEHRRAAALYESRRRPPATASAAPATASFKN